MSSTEVQFRLYHSDRVSNNEFYHDCLLHNEAGKPPRLEHLIKVKQLYHVIPYCIRPPDLHANAFVNNETRVDHGTAIQFETLQSQNVTSEELYYSSASIDVVERYQAFLENSNQSSSTQIFYNCSIPWFGEFCQYTFNLVIPLDEIILDYFKATAYFMNNGTCYTFMKCDRGSPLSCLDWREICDGKIDCLDGGADELDCDILDSNECTQDEFRCNNGLCIPNDFFNDDRYNTDCIDHSDERHFEIVALGLYYDCHFRSGFRCEETACRDERGLFSENGQCSYRADRRPRHNLLKRAKLSRNANLHLPFDCWTNLICLFVTFHDLIQLSDPVNCIEQDLNEKLVRENCPVLFFFPAHPTVLGHVRFVYKNNLTKIDNVNRIFLPDYVCYDQQLCQNLPSTVRINDSSCRSLSELNLEELSTSDKSIEIRLLELFLKCSTTKNSYIQCPQSKPFRCANSSKCLRLNQLLDGFSDCFEGDDEQIKDSCSLPDIHYRFKCLSDNKCIPLNSMSSRIIRCAGGEDQEKHNYGIYTTLYFLSFRSLCDGFIEHQRMDGLNYTDETECEHWPCNNAYTRCDSLGIWNCPDGADEANCPSNPCRPNSHPCVSTNSSSFTCLPLSQGNNGHIDCLGSYDEQGQCPQSFGGAPSFEYRCLNETKCISVTSVCDSKRKDCAAGDDEGEWCAKLSNFAEWISTFDVSSLSTTFDVNLYLYRLGSSYNNPKAVHFKLTNHLIYPATMADTAAISVNATITAEITLLDKFNHNSNRQSIDNRFHTFCHRGIPIGSNNSSEKSCLCPPAYFGYRCEYQSQRVSLTLQFRTVEWRTVFTFVMMLVDNDTNINSYEQVNYIATRDCAKKFHIYLLYSTRPKYLNRTYYVRIDVYEKYKKVKSEYYVSMFYPIPFPFLPVHRLSFQVNVPVLESLIISKNCPLKCIHGECKSFVNLDKWFCRCSDGYAGMLCTVKNDCQCSSDSICVGTINNRSICVCPLNKFGPRCHLATTICTPNPCDNGGQCVVADKKTSENEYFCVCRDGFTGLRCENLEMKIEFLFAKSIPIPQSILIHFINVPPKFNLTKGSSTEPTQTTLIVKVGYDQISTAIYYGEKFHLIFVEFNDDYFLALLQHNYTSFVSTSTTIIPEHRCASISELLDSHILDYRPWRRAKYYHIPCQKRLDLACFYDNDQFMCLCDIDRHANCFEFDYRRVHDCFGRNYCENGGQCYQNNNNCPTSSSCSCPKCYYGHRCQFTSTGFGLSLDDILGYSIWPNVPFSRQPKVVYVSTAFTIIMFVIAMINGVLSITTFRTKRSLGVGCGFYLLATSITSCLTMLMFALKFLLLILSQTSMITNHSFLLFNCIIMDMLLKALLAIGDWLNACVAVERALTIHSGIKFNKIKSKKIAKWVIGVVCLFTLTSYIYDPIHRHLLEDKEEQRKWCVVRYSSSIKAFASFINIFHFLSPLAMNVMCALLIIVLVARQKLKINEKQTHREHLWKQFHEHKHRLFSSFILIIIAMPRLVISFLSTCMESARNPWLYLGSYFLSFVPPLLVFVLFVLPSKFYRKEFDDATIHIKRTLQRRFHLI